MVSLVIGSLEAGMVDAGDDGGNCRERLLRLVTVSLSSRPTEWEGEWCWEELCYSNTNIQ